ncbi:MAG: hypothetical protein ORN54_04375 [Cyclobacteriaceae bacterium]|nr:hypothetical protein [Cyclobacteriaceae bacterium]
MAMFKKKSDYFVGVLIFGVIIGLLLVVSFDALFSPPSHLQGHIVEKIFSLFTLSLADTTVTTEGETI